MIINREYLRLVDEGYYDHSSMAAALGSPRCRMAARRRRSGRNKGIC